MAQPRSAVIKMSDSMSVEGVQASFVQLNSQLEALGLGQFMLFNKAYLVVTNLMQGAIEQGHFANPKFIEKFIVQFASYYFQAVNDCASGAPELSPPWAKLRDYGLQTSSPIFISLMLGANAHINYDLPQVLHKLMRDEQAEGLLKDVAKVDKLLMKSGKEIIGLFAEKNTYLDFLKRRFQFAYYRPAMYTILFWRINAWRSYKKLKKDDTALADITARSVKIANRHLKIAKILG